MDDYKNGVGCGYCFLDLYLLPVLERGTQTLPLTFML